VRKGGCKEKKDEATRKVDGELLLGEGSLFGKKWGKGSWQVGLKKGQLLQSNPQCPRSRTGSRPIKKCPSRKKDARTNCATERTH